MLPVYICEDDKWQLNNLRKLITRILEVEKLTTDVEIVCATHDPQEILKMLEGDTNPPGLYFLDVQLGEGVMNGIDLGVNIKKADTKAYIVMVTIHADAAPRVFELKVGAKDYILKDRVEDFPRRIKECILDAWNSLKPHVVGFPDFMISTDEIYYIQSSAESKKLIYIHGKYKTKKVRVTLCEIERKLNNSFFACHRTYIVNLKYVVGINKENHTATLENGEEIPVSWRRLKELEIRYMDFMNK